MYEFVEMIAVISGATEGVLLARRHRIDFVGAFSVAFICAFGGGTLRDLFRDRHPLFWIQEEHYSVIVFLIALVASSPVSLPRWSEKVLSVPDALGLGLFRIVGAAAALQSRTSAFIASLLGVVTGTFGGVMGDIVCNQVLSLFRQTPIYATGSFAGCWWMLTLGWFGFPRRLGFLSAIVVIVAFRLLALRYNWRLPQHDVAPHADHSR